MPDALAGAPSAADALLREAHHRISNHLQILASLVSLQAHGSGEQTARDALLDVRQRLLAVGRIHRQLQVGGGEDSVEISGYLRQLREDLLLCYGLEGGRHLDLQFDVETAHTTSDAAMTIGLIVNELVTNSIKHALPAFGGGVRVSLGRQPNGLWRLTVSDAGQGPPEAALNTKRGGGFSLLRGMADKLKGQIEVRRGPEGSSVSVIYP